MNFKWENAQKSGIFQLNFTQKVSFDIGTIQASIWKPQTRNLRPIWGLKTRKCVKSDLIPYLLYFHFFNQKIHMLFCNILVEYNFLYFFKVFWCLMGQKDVNFVSDQCQIKCSYFQGHKIIFIFHRPYFGTPCIAVFPKTGIFLFRCQWFWTPYDFLSKRDELLL